MMKSERAIRQPAWILCTFAAAFLMLVVCMQSEVQAATLEMPSSWQGTYYKYVTKTSYVRLKLMKYGYTAKLYRKGKKPKIIEKGTYRAWQEEAMQYTPNLYLLHGKTSYVLFGCSRSTSGKKMTVSVVKHYFQGIPLRYLPGNYYKSQKTAQKHVQKVS